MIFAADLDAHAQSSSPAVPVRLRGQVTKALDLDAHALGTCPALSNGWIAFIGLN